MTSANPNHKIITVGDIKALNEDWPVYSFETLIMVCEVGTAIPPILGCNDGWPYIFSSAFNFTPLSRLTLMNNCFISFSTMFPRGSHNSTEEAPLGSMCLQTGMVSITFCSFICETNSVWCLILPCLLSLPLSLWLSLILLKLFLKVYILTFCIYQNPASNNFLRILTTHVGTLSVWRISIQLVASLTQANSPKSSCAR